MRIDRVRVEHFGGLKHFDTGADPMGRLVVVFGPNESGKSTFFNFTRSMIYGFSPAARATNPYTPWSGADIEGHISGQLDSGDPFAVRRRLRSSPWGRLQLPDGEIELRNRPVPFAEHVPATVFSKLFALTLDELAALDRDTWGGIQDRLLASMVLDDLNPAGQVAQALHADARALWRPDNRGHPRDRKITAQIKELQSTRRVAADRDDALRRNQHDLENATTEYARLRAGRDGLAVLLRGLERVVPANQRLRRLREAREQSELADTASDLPENPTEVIERLESDLVRFQRDVDRIEVRRASLRQEIASYTERDRGLMALSSTLRGQEASFEMLPALEGQVQARREALAAVTQRLDERCAELFEASCTTADALKGISAISLVELDEAIESRPTTEGDPFAPDVVLPMPVSTVDSLLPALVAMVLGAVLLLTASSTGGVVLAAFGGALLVFAMGALVLAWDRRRRGAGIELAANARRQEERAHSERTRTERRSRARELLDGLNLRSELLVDPQPSLIKAFRDLGGLERECEERAASLDESASEFDTLVGVVDPLFEAAGFTRTDGALELFRALDGAERRFRLSEQSGAALQELDEERRDLEAERVGARATVERLRERLTEIGGGSLERGAEELAQWRVAERRTRDLERDFRRDLGEPDDVAGEVIDFRKNHPDLALEHESLEEVRAELDEATRRAEAEGGLIQRLETEVRFLEGGDTPTEIDGRVAALSDERTRLRRERDRLAMLGSIVDEAERRFKEHHQPDVLERSAAYLSAITDGRYRRLLPAHEGKDGVLSLETAEGRPVGLDEALSRGTKEQVLLSLRLAAADHMDQGGERLPLFVDEVFVNWDRGRRERGLELLRHLSESRQVFVFTCHAQVSERLASLGSNVFELPTA